MLEVVFFFFGWCTFFFQSWGGHTGPTRTIIFSRPPVLFPLPLLLLSLSFPCSFLGGGKRGTRSNESNHLVETLCFPPPFGSLLFLSFLLLRFFNPCARLLCFTQACMQGTRPPPLPFVVFSLARQEKPCSLPLSLSREAGSEHRDDFSASLFKAWQGGAPAVTHVGTRHRRRRLERPPPARATRRERQWACCGGA